MQTLNTDKNQTNIVPLFAIATFALHFLTLILLMFHGGMLQQVKRKSVPQILVQLADGRVITADATSNLERDMPKASSFANRQTIRRFVGETMTLMFTWSQKQSSTVVWNITSELLRNDFQRKFAQRFNNFELESPEENVLVIQRISQPEVISEGKWKVEILGNRLIFSRGDNLGKSVPFNKQIFVEAIDEVNSLPNIPTPLNLAVYRLGEARIQIYNICDIEDKSCYENKDI
ncbi:hypothetical protein IQ247_17140 [Plectonema cf. radiosum LEGE 06105]|uniref:Uncharacterized protein n=1 Tax=Plectonema cf. radiosum LEGE 06105 TaxID=945769 RepID=A0A8J7K2L5_9CYAN|nr:hypothetical protein [Plectonema radiosum]MBE9214372.1 hypothetical protein [Plectonema cf. radiosum LEGE 06105]